MQAPPGHSSPEQSDPAVALSRPQTSVSYATKPRGYCHASRPVPGVDSVTLRPRIRASPGSALNDLRSDPWHLQPHLPLAHPGIDQFSSAQLLRTARLFASDPALPGLVDPHNKESQWVELDSGPNLQIWLLCWPAGTQNGSHDHGESAGAFQVFSGTLLEQTSSGYRLQFRTLVAGEGRSFEQNHIHHLGNVRMGTALSVHFYPRLTTTTRYAITPTGLKSGAVDLNGLGW